MSAIAEFIKLPKSALDGLSKAAIPKKSFFGRPRDTYHEYLNKRGKQVVDYRWSGYVLATLLVYPDEKHQIDLMKSEHEALASGLTKARRATHIILTNELRSRFLSKLSGMSVSEQELLDYYNHFNEAKETEAGKPMLDGIKAFRQALEQTDEASVVLFVIG
jgi:hypothetical protein